VCRCFNEVSFAPKIQCFLFGLIILAVQESEYIYDYVRTAITAKCGSRSLIIGPDIDNNVKMSMDVIEAFFFSLYTLACIIYNGKSTVAIKDYYDEKCFFSQS